MTIVTAIDGNFVEYGSVFLESLYCACAQIPTVIILTRGIAEEHSSALWAVARSHGADLRLIEAPSFYDEFWTDKHASAANYFRIGLPDLLEPSLEKVIYLDADTLIRSDLAPLWAVSLGGCYVAAVPAGEATQCSRLKMDPTHGYFNSGVLVVNLDLWRQDNLTAKLIALIKEEGRRLEYWDQDALNLVIKGQWRRLDRAWNATEELCCDPIERMRYQQAAANPAVVHFTGQGRKPFDPGFDASHPFFAEYSSVARRIGLRVRRFPQGDGVVRPLFLRKLINRLLNISPIKRRLLNWADGTNRCLAQESSNSAALARRLEERRMSEKLGGNLKVMGGPFAGMQYPSLESIGSAVLPKLVGCYEAELHGLINSVFRERCYSKILDVGCAEGYYAVGFARAFPETVVLAFDTSVEARRLCRAMASANQVSNLSVNERFSLDTLPTLNDGERGLLFMDCEGAERAILFREHEAYARLAHYDLLIEMHDFVFKDCSTYLLGLLKETHNLEVLHTLPEQARARELILAGFTVEERLRVVAEERPCAMEWVWAMARK
jgi:lipopolysaccharide biosynthesis glycosyltransferase